MRAYRSDWLAFCDWARARGHLTLPAAPETVSLYIGELAGRVKTSTIARRLSSIAHVHRTARVPSPTHDSGVRALWNEIRRRHGAEVQAVAPLDAALLGRVVERLPRGLGGDRDRAVLLVGFAAGLRRSELVAIDAEDLVIADHGMVLTLRRPGGTGAQRTVGVGYGRDSAMCTVRAVAAWCDGARISSGPLFRPVDRHGRVRCARLSGAGVNRIVQRAVRTVGVDPAPYSAQSLRAGWAAAAAAGAISVLPPVAGV